MFQNFKLIQRIKLNIRSRFLIVCRNCGGTETERRHGVYGETLYWCYDCYPKGPFE